VTAGKNRSQEELIQAFCNQLNTCRNPRRVMNVLQQMKFHKDENGLTMELQPGDIPGTVEREDGIYYPVGGVYYRVEAVQIHPKYGLVPILDMPLTDMPAVEYERTEK